MSLDSVNRIVDGYWHLFIGMAITPLVAIILLAPMMACMMACMGPTGPNPLWTSLLFVPVCLWFRFCLPRHRQWNTLRSYQGVVFATVYNQMLTSDRFARWFV